MKLTSSAAVAGALSYCLGAAALEVRSSPLSHEAALSIPSSYQSAVMGRRILALTKLATLSTVFPQSGSRAHDDQDEYGDDEYEGDASQMENRPAGLAGVPIGLMDYIADCEDEGNPTILAIKIATSFKNVKAGSNITVSMRWTPPFPPARRMSLVDRIVANVPFLSPSPHPPPPPHHGSPDTVPYSAANLPRFSLVGYLEPIKPGPVDAVKLAACFTSKHHDAKWWLPGNMIHESEWVRLVVTGVYWVGGFGDRAYIGWIPVEEWHSVTKQEWSSIKLPGEEPGWKEWSVDAADEL